MISKPEHTIETRLRLAFIVDGFIGFLRVALGDAGKDAARHDQPTEIDLHDKSAKHVYANNAVDI